MVNRRTYQRYEAASSCYLFTVFIMNAFSFDCTLTLTVVTTKKVGTIGKCQLANVYKFHGNEMTNKPNLVGSNPRCGKRTFKNLWMEFSFFSKLIEYFLWAKCSIYSIKSTSPLDGIVNFHPVFLWYFRSGRFVPTAWSSRSSSGHKPNPGWNKL